MSGTVTVVEDCPLKWTLSARVRLDPAKGDPSSLGKIQISIVHKKEEGETAAVCHALLGKGGESPVECLLTGHEPRSYSLTAQTEDGHWWSPPCDVSLDLGQAQTASLELEHRAVAHGVIDSGNVDLLLQRGDVLIKFAGGHTTFTEKLIEKGEEAVKKLSGLFHQGIKKGDPTCFHVAVYLGGGETAEAHGGSYSNARVSKRGIDEHEGFLFRVYRCQDRALAEAAAKVAETWATGRMRYLIPALVPFKLSSFGPAAHGEALIFGQQSGQSGGPPSFKKMFCSQFAIAVYQAAAVARQLRERPTMASSEVEVPPGLDLHASNSSPLALHARLEGAQATWKYVDEVLVRPQGDANRIVGPAPAPGKDVTSSLELLGNPTEKRWPSGEWVYARNPWSLRAFGGRIYVGNGNSNNPPPAANAGPVDLWALDPRTGSFEREYEVPDEQVDILRVLSDGLWIPGHDSKVTERDDQRVKGESTLQQMRRLIKTAIGFPADWAFGNAHHKNGAKWETHRSIPNGIHVYDLIDFGGDLYAAVATVAGGMVARSKDRGRTWEELLTKPFPFSRARSLFVLDDDTGPRLYASTNGGRIYRSGGEDGFAEMKVRFFPGLADLKEVFAARPTSFRTQVAFIGARQIIDHDWAPLGLFAAAQPDSARALPLPGGALPRDLLVHDDALHVLASTQPSPRTTRVHVFATRDLESFAELCSFEAETFARSFEMLEGDLYFGMGCDPELLQPQTGQILKLPASALQAGG
jgi:hypothetical protein